MGRPEVGFRRASNPKGLGDLPQRLAEAERRNEKLQAAVAAVTNNAETLRSAVDALRAELRQLREGDTATLRDRVDEAVRTTEGTAVWSKDEFRKHASAIDVLRRHQRHLEDRIAGQDDRQRAAVVEVGTRVDDQAARADVLRAALDEVSGRLDRTIGRLDTTISRVDADLGRLDTTLTRLDGDVNRVDAVATRFGADVGRFDTTLARLDGDVTRLGTTVERVDGSFERVDGELAALRAAGADTAALTQRHESALAEVRQQFEHERAALTAELAARIDQFGGTTRERLERVDTRLHELTGRLAALDAAAAGLDDLRSRMGRSEAAADAARRELHEFRAEADPALADLAAAVAAARERFAEVAERLEPLGPALSLVSRLDAAVAAFGERLDAAEVLLNQRDDLATQLDRAEEFERLVAELDPDRYVSRQELDELRALLDGQSQESGSVRHDA